MSLTNKIYEAVREEIIQLRMKPGEKISEAKLARKYQVSRAPIRNVIQKLQQEGLVMVKPQMGTIIMAISRQKAIDILQVRLLLETYATEIAATCIQDEDLDLLNSKLSELEAKGMDSSEKRDCLFSSDNFLHETIWRLCGNKEIQQILNNYRDEMQRIRLANVELVNRLVPSEREMQDIYRALRARDPVAAREAMRIHLSNINDAVAQATLTNEADADVA